MEIARQTFEILMLGNGFSDFEILPNGNYKNSGVQTRWRYFLLGWQMRGLKHEL
jgi:hypothetical protein